MYSLFGVRTIKNLDELKNDLDEKLEIHTIKVDQISRIVKLQQENIVEIRSLVEQLANFTQKEYNLYKIRGDVIRMCSAFNEIRINLELNHLNIDMINSLQIKKLVQKYSSQWNLNTLYNVDHPRFENTVVIKVVSTYEGKLALITIPFFPHETYLLYRLHKLPMFTNSSNTKKFILNSKFDYILSSSDQSKVALLKSRFLETCPKRLDEVLICPNIVFMKVNSKTKKTCEIGVFLENSSENCDFEVVSNRSILVQKN